MVYNIISDLTFELGCATALPITIRSC